MFPNSILIYSLIHVFRSLLCSFQILENFQDMLLISNSVVDREYTLHSLHVFKFFEAYSPEYGLSWQIFSVHLQRKYVLLMLATMFYKCQCDRNV